MRMNEPPGLRSKEENVNPRGDDDHFPLKADGSDFPCQNSHRDPGHNPIRNYTVGTSVPVQYVSPGLCLPSPSGASRLTRLIIGLCLEHSCQLVRRMVEEVASFPYRTIMASLSM